MADWTLRDEIAMRALMGVIHPLANWQVVESDGVEKSVGSIPLYAGLAYQFADAMLAEREKPTPTPESKAA